MNYALQYAILKHGGQTRNFCKEPYINHIVRVAGYTQLYVSEAPDTLFLPVAYLHDVIEDCGVTEDELADSFGEDVAEGVLHLTNLYTKERFPYLKRRERKFKEIERLAECHPYIRQIKLCDRLDNLSDLCYGDDKWRSKYIAETEYMIGKFGDSSDTLTDIIKERLSKWLN